VGRAVTIRYLPVRPDLMEAIQALAKEGDWEYQYNVRAGEDLKRGDVVVVELGGMGDRATFLGDVTALGMQAAAAAVELRRDALAPVAPAAGVERARERGAGARGQLGAREREEIERHRKGGRSVLARAVPHRQLRLAQDDQHVEVAAGRVGVGLKGAEDNDLVHLTAAQQIGREGVHRAAHRRLIDRFDDDRTQ
jgi:hypothetical protein